jgi:hypothetical protein
MLSGNTRSWLALLIAALFMAAACGGDDSSDKKSGKRGNKSDDSRDIGDNEGWSGSDDDDDARDGKDDDDDDDIGTEMAAHFYPGCEPDTPGTNRRVFLLDITTEEETCRTVQSLKSVSVSYMQFLISDEDAFVPKSGRKYRVISQDELPESGDDDPLADIYPEDGKALAVALDKGGGSNNFPVKSGTLEIDDWTDEDDISGTFTVIVDDDHDTEVSGKFRANTCDDGTGCLQ